MRTTIYSLGVAIVVFAIGWTTGLKLVAADKAPAKAGAKAKAGDESKAEAKGKAKGGSDAKAKNAKGKGKGEAKEAEGKKPAAAKKAEPVKKEAKPAPKAVAAKGPMTAVLKLKKKPEVKGKGDEGNVLGVFEYEVVEVSDGDAPGKTIRVAHGVIWDGKVTGATERAVGSTRTLELVPLSDYPGLMKLKVIGGSAEGLYIPKL